MMDLDSLVEYYSNVKCTIDFETEPAIKIATRGERYAQIVDHIYEYISFELYDDADKLSKVIENIDELVNDFHDRVVIATLISIEGGVIDVLASDEDQLHYGNIELWRFNLVCREIEDSDNDDGDH